MNKRGKNQLDPVIVHVSVGQLTIFGVTEDELVALERGSPESIYLNFAISVLSTAISFTVSLLTTKIDSIYTYSSFPVVALGGYLSGLLLIALWWQSRKFSLAVIGKIRNRQVPEGTQEPMPESDVSPS